MLKKITQKLKKKWKKVTLFAIVFVAILSGILMYNSHFKPEELEYINFLEMVEAKEVETIEMMIGSDVMTVIDKNEVKYVTSNPETDTFKEEMLKLGIKVYQKTSTSLKLSSLTSKVFQLALLVLISILVISVARGALSRKDSIVDERPDVTFDDIAGNEEAKEDMKFLIEFLKDPSKYNDMGAKLPRGVVLYGPPGTGKTLMARAVAGEAGVPFYTATGSDFVEMYVGLGAKRVRDLFKQAKESAPSIVFIDEIDAVGTSRGKDHHSEKDQTINALLSELDGFDNSSSVVVIAATNRVGDLDPALIRPGRFDRHVNIGLPDLEGRLAILKNYAKGKNLNDDVELSDIANITIGFSGASLEALMNEASIIAVNKGKAEIDREDIDDSYYKITMKGSKRINKKQDDEEVKLVAYHEAGHALATKLLTDNHLHKVTIIPSTSGAGGATFSVPKKDRLLSRREMINMIKILYAGRAAEEILMGNKDDITSGASSDIQQATKHIHQYFSKLGMSEEFGMMSIDDESLYMKEAVNFSNDVYNETLNLLKDNEDLLHKLAEALIDKETLNRDEVNEIIKSA